MFRRYIKPLLCSITAMVVVTLFSMPAHAVPAFSRAHKVECTTCHTIYPELNEYGDAFLKNSYVYVGKGTKAIKKTTPAPVAVACARLDPGRAARR